MRIKGRVKKCPLKILIDSGSTHNFLDLIMAKRTGQIIQSTNPLIVVVADGTKLLVADGTKLFSKAVVTDFKWSM